MFNLNEYETVEERLKRFWAEPDNKDARIITVNHTSVADRSVSTWIVEARLYLSAEDQAEDLPKTTGWAFEIDGGPGANKSSALENAETSAIGRMLSNYIYSGSKRPSRTEMEKAERGKTPAAPAQSWITELGKVASVEQARELYTKARAAKADEKTLKLIEAKAKELGPSTN
jgi:hypothetical protein